MDEELSAIIKIETVLKFFQKTKILLQPNEAIALLNNAGLIIEPDEFSLLLEKLVRDKYVYEKIIQDFPSYGISYDGQLFHGYLEQEYINGVKVAKIGQSENQIKIYQRQLLWGTWLAGAAVLLQTLWYVFSWFYPRCSDFFCR